MLEKIIYNIDYSELVDFVNVLQKRFPEEKSNLIEAVKTAGRYAVQEWIRTANAKFKHSQGGYVQGILDGVSYPFEGDPLTVQIENKTSYAIYLERGVEPFDLKKMLTTSPKVRVGKEGQRYLVIPFRHGIPNTTTFRSTMPNSIYAQAKQLRPSTIASSYKEGVVQRHTPLENPIPATKQATYVREAEFKRINNPKRVTRYNYVWGDRLTDVGGKFEGMYRFQKNVNAVREEITTNTPLGKFTTSRIVNKTDNNTAYSHYITFRVMSETSDGWLHSVIQPMNILK